VLAAVCVVPAHTVLAQGPGLVTVRVASTPDDQVTPVLYALRTGRFRAAGLDVQLEQSNGGAAIAAGVAGGSYDIGKSSLVALLNAHERGVPFTLIAPGGLSQSATPYGLLIVAKDSSIQSARDLNGKTLAVAALGAVDQIAAMSWIDKNGGDSKTLRFLEMPQTEDGAAIEQHRVDAANTIHPQVDAALATGKVRILANTYPSIAPQYFVSAWFTTNDWAGRHPDIVATFARVVRETAAYTNTHRAETAAMLSEFSGIPLVVVQNMPRAVAGTSLTPNLLQPLIDAAAKYNVLRRNFPAQEIIYSTRS